MSFLFAALVQGYAVRDGAALQAAIVSADSATAVLQSHCETAQIRAVRKAAEARPIPEKLKARLNLRPHETLKHRRVKLLCGQTVFSKADNWYVPERLTADMNVALESSEKPYGRVIAPLKAKRETLSVEGDGSTRRFTVRALLISGSDVPLSVVVERYQVRAILKRRP